MLGALRKGEEARTPGPPGFKLRSRGREKAADIFFSELDFTKFRCFFVDPIDVPLFT